MVGEYYIPKVIIHSMKLWTRFSLLIIIVLITDKYEFQRPLKIGEKNILCDFLIFRSYNFFPMTNLFRYTVFLLGKQEDKSFFCSYHYIGQYRVLEVAQPSEMVKLFVGEPKNLKTAISCPTWQIIIFLVKK